MIYHILRFKLCFLMMIFFLGLTGCSSIDSYRGVPQSRGIPQVPEIKRTPIIKPKTINPRITSSVKRIPNKNRSNGALKQEQLITKEQSKRRAIKNATVEIDPYRSIPESSEHLETAPKSISHRSPAVNSLIAAARADLAIGRAQTAVSKLERGLRIEPQNAELWHMLAKSHFSLSNYQQSISMARKAIKYSENDSFIYKNWDLIKQAAEKSGDANATKEALDYFKVNP